MTTDKRLSLHNELIALLGSTNVYFQPPETVKMKYPCIKYTREKPHVRRADDKRYINVQRYNLIVISPDPDMDLPERIANHFENCEIENYYTSNNLTHCALNLYY